MADEVSSPELGPKAIPGHVVHHIAAREEEEGLGILTRSENGRHSGGFGLAAVRISSSRRHTAR
jgi:hypothetical protein